MKRSTAHRGHLARRLIVGLWSVLFLLSAAPAVADETREAERLFAAGQYDAAERLYRTEIDIEANNPKALYGLAVVLERKGKYDEALELLKKAEKNASVEVDAKTLRAEILLRTGEVKQAQKILEKVLDANPEAYRARIDLGLVLKEQGEKKESYLMFDSFIPLYNGGQATSAELLTYVGIATRNMEFVEDANTCFTDAIGYDDKHVEAYLEAGELFLEKYNQRDADAMFRAVLEIDPNHPRAHVGLAVVAMESHFDLEKARNAIDKALSVNPNHVEALNVLIGIKLSDEDIDGALGLVERALKINPRNLETLSLKTAAHYLDDDEKAVKKMEKKILKLNPRYANLYAVMAQYGEMVHRYEEGISLYKKALKVDPTFWKAFVGLGIAYTRVGDDEKGFEYLDKAFYNDPYNVRAFNMVELYEKTLKNYEFVQGDAMRYRFKSGDEKELLELYIPPLMDGAFALFERKYGFTPSKPVSVEVFSDITSFSVRSVGLPAISPQGICFGKVITARSPVEGNFNWAQVVWHELAHVFHIQLSDSRVPRWFTEGLAEYETIIARREWRREHDIEIYHTLKKGEILGIEKLNAGFTQAKSVTQIVVAYYQASLVIEYIDVTYGFDKLVAMLEAWGQHKKTPEIFQEVLGVSIAEFDKGFEAWLKQKLDYLEKGFELDIDAYVYDGERFLQTASQKPEDAEAQADAGFVRLFMHDIAGARAQLQTALTLDPKSVRGNYLGGVIALREGAYEEALAHYTTLLEMGIDGYTLRSELGFLHLKVGQGEKAIEHYNQAKTFYPHGEEPYRELSKYYLENKEQRKARDELKKLSGINQNDYNTPRTIVELALDAGDTGEARRYGELALDIYPFEPELHAILGKVAIEQEDWLFAEREFQAYLVVGAQNPFPGYIGLAEVYAQLGQSGSAKKYIKRAKAASPDSPEISRVEAMLE